jgi:hypothetical protein
LFMLSLMFNACNRLVTPPEKEFMRDPAGVTTGVTSGVAFGA